MKTFRVGGLGFSLFLYALAIDIASLIVDGGIYEAVVDRGAPGGGPEVDTVAQGVGARQQRPALTVRSGERLLAPGHLPRLKVAVNKAAPGEILTEVLHRLGADNARQVVADEFQQLRLLLFD